MPLNPPDMSKVHRLLIVKLSSIGDVVHALPVSAALGESFPQLKITWAVEEMSAPMVTGNSYLDDVIVIPAALRESRLTPGGIRELLALRQDLRRREFDVTIDLQGLTKSALVAWASGARYRYGYDWLRELAPILETRVSRRPENVHVVDQFLDVARFLGATVDKPKFPLHIPKVDDCRAEELLEQAGVLGASPFIVINPSSGGGGFKGWGAERFAALLDHIHGELGFPVVAVGAKSDLGVANQIAKLTNHAPISLVGQTNLKELAAILKRCALHICGDTGSAHIAAAVGTAVVSIFGRSNPARLAPYGQEDLAVHRREACHAVCRRFHEAASVNSKQKCLSPPPACLAAVTVEDVIVAVKRGLDRKR